VPARRQQEISTLFFKVFYDLVKLRIEFFRLVKTQRQKKTWFRYQQKPGLKTQINGKLH
jgi:hypothetical protein